MNKLHMAEMFSLIVCTWGFLTGVRETFVPRANVVRSWECGGCSGIAWERAGSPGTLWFGLLKS